MAVIACFGLISAACSGREPPDGGDFDATLGDAISERTDVLRLDIQYFDVLDVPDDVPIFEDAACGANFRRHDEDPGMHLPPDADLRWPTNPPSSGPHYEDPARWGIYHSVVPRGNWVHSIEHGGVAVLYRCSGACETLRAQLEAFVRALPPEPICVGGEFARRVLLTEDPLIDTMVAAAAWGWTYRADCFDAASLAAFVQRRTGRGPKSSCTGGTYPPIGSDM